MSKITTRSPGEMVTLIIMIFIPVVLFIGAIVNTGNTANDIKQGKNHITTYCYDGVEYVEFNGGNVIVAVALDGTPKTCSEIE